MKKRPSRPTVRRPIKGKTVKSTPELSAKPKIGKTAEAVKPSKLMTEMAAKVAKADAQIAKLLEQLASQKEKAAAKRAKSPERGLEDILGGELVWNDKSRKAADQDWRKQFHGFVVVVNTFKYTKDVVVINDPVRPMLALCAIPRDTDHGGRGTEERALGNMAIHWRFKADGTFDGAPAYISEEEFDLVWAEDQDTGGPMRKIEDASVKYVVV
jgi:hypothetical protein